MLDIASIARKSGLLEQDQVSWNDKDVPLHQRGVSASWLVKFVHHVLDAGGEVADQNECDRLASIRYDTPWPTSVALNPNSGTPTGFVVNEVIVPLTNTRRLPLYALVPERYRREPDVFISHAWSNPLAESAPASTLYTLDSRLRSWGPRDFIWIDFACYNQHYAECIADDMKDVIRAIGRLGIPMINSVPFSRLWCLWELLCAHVVGASIEMYEANSSAYDMGMILDRFDYDFRSVENADTTLKADKDNILAAMESTFGSIPQADEYVRNLAKSMLSKHSDKPWNRA